jgi:transcriptional regulator with XRE-family HTH domain
MPEDDAMIQATIMNLKQFIEGEMKRRKLSLREFATLVDVSPSTISRTLSDDAPDPSLDFLVKLSKATSTSLTTIVSMLLPDESQLTDQDAKVLADRIARLSPAKRAIIESFILGDLLNGSDKDE